METPSSLHIAVVLVAMVTISLWPRVSATIDGGSCTAPGSLPPTLVPDQPYSVVWNHPAEHCFRQRGPYNFADYGILENSNHEFIGDRVAVFYELGEWPQLRYSHLDWINGGLPQLANVTKHLELARRQIEQRIPDPNFDGLGVIDMELWRPLFSFNWGMFETYWKKTRLIIKAKNPGWPRARVEYEAAREFEPAARELMEKTLQLAREMRPRGRWGYYSLPDCFADRAFDCSDTAVSGNDRLEWLYNISTGLYPSPYPSPYLFGRRGERARDHMAAAIREGFRVLDASGSRDTLLLPYTWMNMNPVDPEEVELSIRVPAELGVAGVVVGGTFEAYEHPQACDQLQTFLTEYLGPLTQQLLERTHTCSHRLCSGHGRCTHKCVLESPARRHCGDFDLSQPAFSEPFGDTYGCRCYPGWTGQSCSLPA